MDLAIKDVQRHLGKFVVTTAGVGLLLAIVLMMNGIYRGGIADGAWMIAHTKTDLWAVQRDRGGPFNEQSSLPEALYHSVASVAGVRSASPYIAYGVQRVIAGTSQQLTIVGYDIFGGAGGPSGIATGRSIAQAHYEAVADERLGLRLGQTFHLGIEDYTVVGMTVGAVGSGGDPILYLSLRDAQQVLYQEDPQATLHENAANLQLLESSGNTPAQSAKLLPLLSGPTNTINAVLITLAPNANRQAVIDNIEQWLYLNVYTSDQETQLLLQGRLVHMTVLLGLFRFLLLVVAIVIITLMVYVMTMEKIKSIATLKLLGARNIVIIRLIMEQSLVLAVGSFVIGYVLVVSIKGRFPGTLLLLTPDTSVTFAVLVIGSIFASVFGIWRALQTSPSVALEG